MNQDAGAGLSHRLSDALSDAKFTRETVTWVAPITDKLFRFRTTRPAGFRFTAGQWARLGIEPCTQTNHTHAESESVESEVAANQAVWRAYSIASANYADELEFYSIVVPGGAFTTQLAQLTVGSALLVEKAPYGFLTTARFQTTRDAQDMPNNELWLLSTGTGLAPFISIVQDLDVWQQYARIIVVHGVRLVSELAYAQDIDALRHHEVFADFGAGQPEKLIYLPVISREAVSHTAFAATVLHGRITDLLQNGALEAAAGVVLDPQRSRVMICGNPEMVTDTRNILKARGLTVSRSAAPGQIAVENYW